MPFPNGGYRETSISMAASPGDTTPNKKITLQIYSYISQEVYDFEAYIYNFGFSISSDISENTPFGRSSRIYTYGGTTRGDIKIDFFELVNSHNENDINETYARTSRILKQMYPQYGATSNSMTLEKAPLFRIYSPAYITNGGVTADDAGFKALPNGLLGYIKSLDVSIDRSTDGAFGHFIEGSYAALSPKINYSMTIAPIEDFALGFTADDKSGEWDSEGPNWPMGFDSNIDPSDRVKDTQSTSLAEPTEVEKQESETPAEAIESLAAALDAFNTLETFEETAALELTIEQGIDAFMEDRYGD